MKSPWLNQMLKKIYQNNIAILTEEQNKTICFLRSFLHEVDTLNVGPYAPKIDQT